jgi:hypothetical protein
MVDAFNFPSNKVFVSVFVYKTWLKPKIEGQPYQFNLLVVVFFFCSFFVQFNCRKALVSGLVGGAFNCRKALVSGPAGGAFNCRKAHV